MNKPAMKLVLPNHTEVSIAELEEFRDRAIDEWRKAEKAQRRAQSRMRDAESVLSSCVSRIRLLRILENNT